MFWLKVISSIYICIFYIIYVFLLVNILLSKQTIIDLLLRKIILLNL